MCRTWSLDNFDDRRTKRVLEKHICGKAGKIITSHFMVITGPAVLEHLPNAIKIAKTEKCNIYIVEKDPSVFNKIKERIQEISKIRSLYYNTYSGMVMEYDVEGMTNVVMVAHGDVENYENLFNLKLPCRAEDLDLCKSFKSERNRSIFINRLFKQSRNYNEKYGKLRKLFMGTVSLRGYSMQKTVEFINTYLLSIIDTEIDVRDAGPTGKTYSGYLPYHSGANRISIYKPKILKQGRLETFELYSYSSNPDGRGAPMLCFVITYK